MGLIKWNRKRKYCIHPNYMYFFRVILSQQITHLPTLSFLLETVWYAVSGITFKTTTECSLDSKRCSQSGNFNRVDRKKSYLVIILLAELQLLNFWWNIVVKDGSIFRHSSGRFLRIDIRKWCKRHWHNIHSNFSLKGSLTSLTIVCNKTLAHTRSFGKLLQKQLSAICYLPLCS